MNQVDSNSTTKLDEKPRSAPAAIPHKTSAMGKLKGMFRKKQQVEGEDDDDDEVPTQGVAHIDPALDNTDPTPFLQKPSALAALVDPKSLASLEAMGGIEGVIHGLGTDAVNGLSNLPIPAGAEVEAGGPRGQAVNGAEKRLGAQYNASLADRERVYGRNFVPPKKPKTLFQLMWAAMKDKVLVSLIHVGRSATRTLTPLARVDHFGYCRRCLSRSWYLSIRRCRTSSKPRSRLSP
jgi:hypothetical protein